MAFEKHWHTHTEKTNLPNDTINRFPNRLNRRSELIATQTKMLPNIDTRMTNTRNDPIMILRQIEKFDGGSSYRFAVASPSLDNNKDEDGFDCCRIIFDAAEYDVPINAEMVAVVVVDDFIIAQL